jgi:glyoxylase-like metal-dependent hydrolase (beta-lactamase superfamily II)
MMTALIAALATAFAAPHPHAEPTGAPATIHVHAAGDAGFRANAYLVEGDEGVVAVDAPFTNSEARKFREELDALKKPLLAVLVTHAHPDHVNGITALVEGQPAPVPVLATEGVLETLKAIDGPKRAYWSPIYKDEYPAKTTFPDRVVKDNQTVTYGGLSFTAHDLGKGEAESSTAWVLLEKRPAAFVGDLVMNHVHPWLAEGRSAAWIAQLDQAKKLLYGVERFYPGHGEKGGYAVLEWQKKYLGSYRSAVAQIAAGKKQLDDAGKKDLESRMEAVLPKAPLSMLVPMSADAVAAELAAEGKQ